MHKEGFRRIAQTAALIVVFTAGKDQLNAFPAQPSPQFSFGSGMETGLSKLRDVVDVGNQRAPEVNSHNTIAADITDTGISAWEPDNTVSFYHEDTNTTFLVDKDGHVTQKTGETKVIREAEEVLVQAGELGTGTNKPQSGVPPVGGGMLCEFHIRIDPKTGLATGAPCLSNPSTPRPIKTHTL